MGENSPWILSFCTPSEQKALAVLFKDACITDSLGKIKRLGETWSWLSLEILYGRKVRDLTLTSLEKICLRSREREGNTFEVGGEGGWADLLAGPL